MEGAWEIFEETKDDVEGMRDGMAIEEMGDDVVMGNAKEVGIVEDEKNVFEEETAGEGKQHSEELEQKGPVELHDPDPANTAMPPISSNLI